MGTAGAAVLVEAWIVDGETEPDRLSARQDDPERRRQFVPLQPARYAEIDRRHDRIVGTPGV